MNIKERIDNILNDKFGIEKTNLKDDLNDDLGLDSMERLELILYIEKAYEISVPDLELENINTIFDLVNEIDKRFVCICITSLARNRCKFECKNQ